MFISPVLGVQYSRHYFILLLEEKQRNNVSGESVTDVVVRTMLAQKKTKPGGMLMLETGELRAEELEFPLE